MKKTCVPILLMNVVNLSEASVVTIGSIGCGDVLLYAIVLLLVSIIEGATVVEVVVVVVVVVVVAVAAAAVVVVVVDVVVVFSFSFVSLTGLSVGNFSYSGLMDGGNKIVVNVTDCCVVDSTGFVLVR